MPDDYDLIVIGSGMGGLAVASLAARLASQRVLLLERHFKLGGFTHDFRRGKFRWDVGLHYVGEMGEGTQMRKVMDLVTGGEVAWSMMPDPMERFVYPGFTFDVPVGRRAYQDALKERFPEEQAALDRYFARVKKAATGLGMHVLRRSGSALLRTLGRVVGWLRPGADGPTTKEVLDETVESPELRALLASIWATYGLPPRHSAFAMHALLAYHHYMEGAWYPVGGAGTIAESVKRAVEAAGGKTMVRRSVEEILVEDGRAVGVRARSTAVGHEDEVEEFRAPVVVSNAGAAATWLRMVPDAHAEPHRSTLRAFLDRHPVSTSAVLYLGLSESPASLGFRGENHWLFRDLDHDAGFDARRDWVEDGEPRPYLSFPSLKDPEAKAHTAEAMTFSVDYDDFARWKDAPWRRRGPEYDALKRSIADRFLAVIERHYPGFGALVVHAELSTPITNEYFTGHPQGRVYGLPLVPELYGDEVARATHPRTDVPGLYLTGADAAMHGILGALWSGVTTIGHLPNGPSAVQVFKAAEKARRNR